MGNHQRELDFAAKEGRFEHESWRIRKDKSRFWANVVLTAIRDEQEKPDWFREDHPRLYRENASAGGAANGEYRFSRRGGRKKIG